MKFLITLTLSCGFLLFLTSCSTTQKITSQFITPESADIREGNLSDYMTGLERESIDGLSFYISHDDQNLYLLVDFVSSRLFQLAREFGFTVYIDHEDKFDRSFGITYPTGLYYELGNYPGARKGYVEQPDWENYPDNISIMETAGEQSFQRSLLVQRRNRQQDLNPVPVPLGQLEAQSLRLHIEEDGRSGLVFYTIPLETRSTSQFSPDVRIGESLNLGFEIHPVRLFNLDEGLSAPRTTHRPPGRRTGTTSYDQPASNADEETRNHIHLIMRRLVEPYEEWVEVSLAPSSGSDS